MRRLWVILLVMAIAVSLLCLIHKFQTVTLDGDYDLTIRIESPGQSMRAVCCESIGCRQWAENAVEYLLPPESHYRAVADPYEGQPMRVHVPVTWRHLSLFGFVFELSRY